MSLLSAINPTTFQPVNTLTIPGNMLRAYYDQRSTLQKTVDFTLSLFRQIQYVFTVLYHRMHSHSQPCGQQIEWKQNSQGLVVLLHGLRNDPAAWFSQLSLLKEHAAIDVFAPIVPHRGLCSLEEASSPILPAIEDFAQKNPGKPICLLGVSNGSRITTWLETRLRQTRPAAPVLVSTIAGVHLGSSRMNLLDKLHLASYFYPSVLGNELRYNSDTARKLLEEVRAPLPFSCAPRSYEFYATTDDVSVPDLDSSLPQIGKGEECYILHGQSHDSIVTAVADKQIGTCVDWIRRSSN